MRTKIAEYNNGNVHVIRFSDGTVIRFSEDNEFNFAFPENMDVKICDRCDRQCKFCHEGSTPDGKLGDILNAAWVDTIHPFTEAALGGGNVFEHPDFIPFLKKLKEKQVFANITVNQVHFMQNLEILEVLSNMGWVHGIGVSLVNPTEELFEALKKFPNAVVHVIAGILNEDTLAKLMEHGEDLKILILGYKKIRRGKEYYKKDFEDLGQNIDWGIGMLERRMSDMFEAFKVVSFDCLAIEQLHVKDHLPKQIWDQFYQGDDGTMTFYIDMVNNQFAESSTASFEKRYPVMNSVDDMFWQVRNNKLPSK
jgi:hypothetical protein